MSALIPPPLSVAKAIGIAFSDAWKPMLAASALSVSLASCSSVQPVKYQNLASSSAMTANAKDEDGRTPFRFMDPNIDWHGYSAVALDPVAVYAGSDQQFDDLSEKDKAELASYMQDQFSTALSQKFKSGTSAAPGTLRIHLTLTGVESSTPVLSTVSKILPAGLVVNSVQTARDKPAAFTGSVVYAVEIYDGPSGKLLSAFITKQYPWAENVAASFGTLDAARAGIRTGAETLTAQLQ